MTHFFTVRGAAEYARALARRGAVRSRARRLAQFMGLPLLWLAHLTMRFYRPTFHETSPWVYRMAERTGVYPVLDHYHEPLVSMRHLEPAQCGRARSLPGIDLRVGAQLRLLAELRYGDEIEVLAAADDVRDAMAPTFHNLAFGPGDAEVLYSVLRYLKPARVLEVGSGHSTRFAKAALDHNRSDGNVAHHVCIEPYESPWLETMGLQVVRSRVEDVDRAVFLSLLADDVLFIDSSHVVRPQGDVLYLIHEVLPSLAAGVVVHIHDIFTPRDYPTEWLRRRWLWTEQYLVEALLVDNPRYEILLAVNHLFWDHRADLVQACPVIGRQTGKEPGSLWLRVR